MAKHCNVCDRDYADNLTTCPHCAAAKKTRLASRSEERTTQLKRDDDRVTKLEATPADSAVNLGDAAEEPDESQERAAVSEDEVLEAVDEEPAADHTSAPAESGFGVGKFEQNDPTASDVAMEELMSNEEPAGEEQAVSEKEVDDLLANLEEEPAPGAAQEAAEIAEGEEAIAAAEAEEAAEAAEAAQAEEEEKPPKAPKPRSNIPALAGATVVGILLGVGGTVGATALMGPGEKEKQPAPLSVPQGLTQGVPTGVAQAKPAPTFEALAARVAGGDLEEAAGIEQVQGTNAKELVARGQYRLMTYLKSVGTKINPQDPALQKALEDLKKAEEQNEPNAFYDLGFIYELAGQFAEASAQYAKAAKQFANDPIQKQRFESAMLRVDLKAAAAKAASAAMLPRRGGLDGSTALLALLVVALQEAPAQAPPQPAQAPQPGQPPAQAPQQAAPPPQPGQQAQPPAAADNKEAGFEFWDAVKQAHAGNFADAIGTLDRAKKLHDQVRFTRLRKAQNPLSDPGEDIFLRCCDELKMYWQLEKELRDGGYLTDKNTPSQALQALAKKAQGGGAASKELMDKLAVAEMAQKSAQTKAADLEKQIQKSKEDNTKLADDLKAAKQMIEARQVELKSAQDQIAKTKGDYDKHNSTLKKVRDDLVAAKLLSADDKADVEAAVKKAIDVAKSKDPGGTLRQKQEEIAQLSVSLKDSKQPADMLPLWLLLLDENREQAALAGEAQKDAQRVLSDPRATAAQKGEAEVVLGLALRNTERFGEAKKWLEESRRAVDNKEWQAHADAALKEVSNPAAYFASQARMWYDHGRMETAVAVLERGMKVLPAKDQGKLLAQRSLIELDAARSRFKGPLPPTDPLLVAAQKDADAAIKAGAAEGHYAAGRIAEELGRVDAAIASYRTALAAYGGKLDAEGSRYRMALARVLLLPREARPNAPVPPLRAAEKVGLKDPAPYPAKLLEDRKKLVLMLTLGLQAPLVPGDEPGQEEAEKLADEVLKAPPGSVPFTVLAQALAVKGRWGEALRVYVDGIRPMLPREYGDGLVYLITNDPRLRRPDSLRTPNPLEAEKHFAAGVDFYFEHNYINAEKEFLLTIENDSQDARFFYFLGLSRLALNRRRDAYADFTQGALLERLNRPASPAVDVSLERIQGPMRYIVNEFRQNPER
ncbi:MAG TPA: hypothetical protein VH592_17865 [Gemmataceae bacterium]|jgi:hypothetical protein